MKTLKGNLLLFCTNEKKLENIKRLIESSFDPKVFAVSDFKDLMDVVNDISPNIIVIDYFDKNRIPDYYLSKLRLRNTKIVFFQFSLKEISDNLNEIYSQNIEHIKIKSFLAKTISSR